MKKNNFEINTYSQKTWRNAVGQYHRDLGPAIITERNVQFWYTNGLMNRADGPAYVDPCGTQIWYVDGKIHRLDGPAIVNLSPFRMRYNSPVIRPTSTWCVNGVDVNKEVNAWMREESISWPWDKEVQMMFLIKFT